MEGARRPHCLEDHSATYSEFSYLVYLLQNQFGKCGNLFPTRLLDQASGVKVVTVELVIVGRRLVASSLRWLNSPCDPFGLRTI